MESIAEATSSADDDAGLTGLLCLILVPFSSDDEEEVESGGVGLRLYNG